MLYPARKGVKDAATDAARLFGVDPAAHRDPILPHYVSPLHATYLGEGAAPNLTQYGSVLDA